MALDDLLTKLEIRAADTSDTPNTSAQVSAQAAPILACTLDTSDTSDTCEITSFWWLLHYSDRTPVQVSYCPPASHADILKLNPAAIAAEPFEPIICSPDTPLSASEEAAISGLLTRFDETDPAMIAHVFKQCQQDATARAYFLKQAKLTQSIKGKHDANH